MFSEIFDFLKNDGYIVLYAFTLILSLYKYPKYFDTILRYFPILIGYVFLTELLGYIIKWDENFQIVYLDGFSTENSIIYNIFDIILFLYFYFVYWKVLRSNKYRNFVKYGSFVFILVSTINPFYQDFVLLPQIYAIAIGSIVLVIGAILYLAELNNNIKPTSNSRNLLFWISIGLLIFYTIYPIVMIAGIYFEEEYKSFQIRRLHLLSITLMYFSFIIGLLRMRRMKPIEENK